MFVFDKVSRRKAAIRDRDPFSGPDLRAIVDCHEANYSVSHSR